MESPIKIKKNEKIITRVEKIIVEEAVLSPEDVRKIILEYMEDAGFKVNNIQLVCDFAYSGDEYGERFPHAYFKNATVELVNIEERSDETD